MKKIALIMAGGRGERFWPQSRRNMPKQFLSLTGDGRTMIQKTVDRILPLVNMEDVYVVTNECYGDLMREQLPGLPSGNILFEPVGRNTAPCIGLGAEHIHRKYGDCLMLVLPSDHLITYEPLFRNALEDACQAAEASGKLITLGITPDSPETGYGYIRFDPSRTVNRAYPVKRFVEKPCLEKAMEYLASREYLWNSGMFIWRTSVILEKLRENLPEMYRGLETIGEAIGTPDEERVLREVFPNLPAISVDYGVMEKTGDILTLAGNFGWDDVGSWPAVGRVRKTDSMGNVIDGNVISVNTSGCVIQGRDRLIAAVGLENMIVVETGDALLVCAKDHAGDIRTVLEKLKENGQTQYL